MRRIRLLAAHENSDAVMGTRDDQLVPEGTKPCGAQSAKAVGEYDGLYVRPRIHGFQILLQDAAHFVRTIMQAYFKKAGFNDVFGSSRV